LRVANLNKKNRRLCDFLFRKIETIKNHQANFFNAVLK